MINNITKVQYWYFYTSKKMKPEWVTHELTHNDNRGISLVQYFTDKISDRVVIFLFNSIRFKDGINVVL